MVELSSADTVVPINIDPVNQRLSRLLSDMIRLMLIFDKRLQKSTHLLDIELFVPIEIKFVKILVKCLL